MDGGNLAIALRRPQSHDNMKTTRPRPQPYYQVRYPAPASSFVSPALILLHLQPTRFCRNTCRPRVKHALSAREPQAIFLKAHRQLRYLLAIYMKVELPTEGSPVHVVYDALSLLRRLESLCRVGDNACCGERRKERHTT